MIGDPDWAEIAKRSSQILNDVQAQGSAREATSAEIDKALTWLIDEEIERVARLDLFAHRMPYPGIAHGVGEARRRLDCVIEGRRRLRERR